MKRKTRKFTTLAGAVRRVRELERIVEQWRDIANEFDSERQVMAMLAADGPAFNNPLLAMQAKARRNEILSRCCRMKPGGSPL